MQVDVSILRGDDWASSLRSPSYPHFLLTATANGTSVSEVDTEADGRQRLTCAAWTTEPWTWTLSQPCNSELVPDVPTFTEAPARQPNLPVILEERCAVPALDILVDGDLR